MNATFLLGESGMALLTMRQGTFNNWDGTSAEEEAGRGCHPCDDGLLPENVLKVQAVDFSAELFSSS